VSGQQAVLQVVILRDGLLVGTEVFVPGQYTLGSSPESDLRLEDQTVAATHATLYFQNGRAAIQDAGSGGVFVNSHRVNACEVRAVDEIACGPFTLKVRVMSKTPTARLPPPADVAAILGGAPPPAAPARAAPQKPSAVPPPPPAPARQGQPPATVVSSRRMSTAPAPAEPVQGRAPHLRPVPIEDVDAETRTESVQLASDFVAGSTAPHRQHDPMSTVPLEGTVNDFLEEAAPYVSAKQQQPPPAQARAPKAAPPPPPPAAPARAAPAAKAKGHQAKRATPAKDRPLPSVPAANDGKGKAHLFVETYWGDTRRFAGAFGRIDPKKHLVARDDDSAALPLQGFGFDGEFVFAEQKGEIYRVYIPPNAAVERRAQDGNFYPVQPDGLEVGSGQRRCVTLASGHALRLSGNDSMAVVYVQPAIPQPFVNPLKGLPWLVLALLALLSSAFAAFIFYFGEVPDNADFNAKTVNPVAVKLIAPPKPEEKKKLEEKVEKLKKPEKKEVAKAEPKKPPKEVVQPPPETKKTLKSIEKLAAAGPAMKDLLAAVDKLGSGPGMKNAKNDFKLSGLIGKAPIASAGIGTFGLGGGGGGGMGIKGAELLRGKGGGGIGALGAGNIGKGSVAGTVTHAVSRSIGATGTIDKEAVAKVINSHLNEVSSCYERALLKTPGLAGKIVLEWQITTSGSVGYAKTKSSSMQSPAVESCIINVLKLWHFPAAKGAGVVITYPFMFNSVGY
jgi:outer membrane biosynthesis protein TonB